MCWHHCIEWCVSKRISYVSCSTWKINGIYFLLIYLFTFCFCLNPTSETSAMVNDRTRLMRTGRFKKKNHVKKIYVFLLYRSPRYSGNSNRLLATNFTFCCLKRSNYYSQRGGQKFSGYTSARSAWEVDWTHYLCDFFVNSLTCSF